MKLAILISGQTSRSMYLHHNLEYLKNIGDCDIYVVLSNTTYAPWVPKIDKNPLPTDKESLYKYYSKYSNNVNIKIIESTEVKQMTNEYLKEISTMPYGDKLLNSTGRHRWECNLRMLLFRNLVLEYAKESKNEYSHFLYFREDNRFDATLDINNLIHPRSIVTCRYNRFSGMCDKIFFGEPYIFDIIFGTNFISYLQEWIKFGSTNKFDYQTEKFYKILIQKNNIKDTIRDFCRNDIRFYKGNIITPSVYSKSRYNLMGKLKLRSMRLRLKSLK